MTSRQLVPMGLAVLIACTGARRAAETALAEADSAIASLPAEAQNVSPEQVATLTEAVKVGRQSIETGDYEAASTSLHGLVDQVKALVDSLPGRKAALAAEMDTLSVAMPRNLEGIKTELDKIARTRRVPVGLDQQQLQEAKDTYASSGQQWADIKAAFDEGKLAQAMNRAHDLKARVSRVMLSLGMVADERAWSNVTLPPRP